MCSQRARGLQEEVESGGIGSRGYPDKLPRCHLANSSHQATLRLSDHQYQPQVTCHSSYKSIHKVTETTPYDGLTDRKVLLHPSWLSARPFPSRAH